MRKYLLFVSLSLAISLCLISSVSSAQFDFFAGGSNGSGGSDAEKMLRQRAKNRTYPGGRDEEPLKVQTQLNFALRKMQPAQEALEPAEEAESHDND